MIQECCCQLLLKMFTVNYVQLSESRRSKQTSGSSSHACVVLRVCNNMPSTSLSRRHEQSASSADQGVQRLRGCDGAGGGENNIFSPILPSAAKMMSLDEETEDFREAALVSQEVTCASRQQADGSGHTGTAAPGAEAGDQYSQFMLRMTQRMERLGNEVNSFRNEMMTIFIMSMNTPREAEARADTAVAAAKDANVRCAQTERVEQEMAQKLGLQDKKIEDLLQKLQAVEYSAQAANTNAAQGAARADANPLPQLDGATMILVTGVGTEGLYETQTRRGLDCCQEARGGPGC